MQWSGGTEVRREVVEHGFGAREDALEARLAAHVLAQVRQQHGHVEADLLHRTVEALREPALIGAAQHACVCALRCSLLAIRAQSTVQYNIVLY